MALAPVDGEARRVEVEDVTPPVGMAPMIDVETLLPIPRLMPSQTFQLIE